MKFSELISLEIKSKQNGVGGNPGIIYYSFSESFDNPLGLNDANKFRMFKISRMVAHILKNFSQKSEIEKFSEHFIKGSDRGYKQEINHHK